MCFVGYPPKGPYDAIHVGAAAPTIPPALVEQLASPGRMIIPVGTYSQRLMQIDKDAQGMVTQRDLFGVVVRSFFPQRAREADVLCHGVFALFRGLQYVPLTDRPT